MGNIALAWVWRTGIGILLGSIAAVIIVYFRPSAGGSGTWGFSLLPDLRGAFKTIPVIRHSGIDCLFERNLNPTHLQRTNTTSQVHLLCICR